MGELAPILKNMISLGFKKIIDFGYIEESWLDCDQLSDSYITFALSLMF